MKIVGLCGGSGSGKSIVAAAFQDNGFFHIDADRVYHDLTAVRSVCTYELASEFGEEILTPDGALDRRRLADIVFRGEGSDLRLKMLNRITHKHVLRSIRDYIVTLSNDNIEGVVVDAPLLFESGFDSECDKVVCVIADKDIRTARIILRDGITESDAIARINSQIPDDKLAKLSDYVIVNNGTVDEIYSQVVDVIKDIKNNER